MFNLRKKDKISVKTKGIGNTISNILAPIPYEVRVANGNWSTYFGKYNNQRWGDWDSNSCWCLSSVNSAEDQIEWLWKNGMFGPESKKFFTDNGYIDSDGDFSLSERFHEILCGNTDKGGGQEEAWQSFKTRGFIPRSMLTYSLEQSRKFKTKVDFNNDYFNPEQVTQKMIDLGQQSLEYIKVVYKTIGELWTTPDKTILKAALKQAPMTLGIPIPYDTFGQCLWNFDYVKFNGIKGLQHAIECYNINDKGEYMIFDQYLPNLKTLSPDYYIPKVIQGIINAAIPASINTVPQPQGEMNNTFWTWVFGWFQGFRNPKVPVG